MLVLVSIIFIEGVNCLNLNGGSINLEVSGGLLGYDFNWSNGVSSEDFIDFQVGEYFVMIMDDEGCIIIVFVIVEENFDLLMVDVNVLDIVICFLFVVILDGMGLFIGFEFIVFWLGLGLFLMDGLIVFVQQSGDFIFIILNIVNGCIVYDIVIVVVDNVVLNVVLFLGIIICDVFEI